MYNFDIRTFNEMISVHIMIIFIKIIMIQHQIIIIWIWDFDLRIFNSLVSIPIMIIFIKINIIQKTDHHHSNMRLWYSNFQWSDLSCHNDRFYQNQFLSKLIVIIRICECDIRIFNELIWVILMIFFIKIISFNNWSSSFEYATLFFEFSMRWFQFS
jgi:hypothetical protein